MSSPNSERNVTTSSSSIRASSTGRRQWTKPSLVSALEVDLSKSNQMIESLKAELTSVKDELLHEKEEKKSLMMTYNDTKARLNNEILTLRKSLSHENVDYVSEIEKYQLVKSNLEEELVNSHILTDSLRGEIDVLKQKLLESENEIVMIESHWQEQMNRVTQQFEQGMLLLKEKMKAKYAKQSTEAIQKQKQAFNQQHSSNNNNSSSSSSNLSTNSNIALTGMIAGQGRLSAGRSSSSSSSSSAMTMTPSAISMASNGPEVISPASTPPSSPRKHRQVPNINAIALNVPKADVNAQVKQIISAAIHNNHNNSGSGSSSSTPRNSISIKSSASSSLHSTPQPSIVNNAKRRESHTPTPAAVTTPVASAAAAAAASSLGSSYDPYNYSIEMKIDARRSSLEGNGSGRIPVGNPSNITATTTTINHSNNIYNNNYPSNPSSSANSTSTNAVASGTNNKSDSPTPLTAMMRKTKINKDDEERGEDPVLDPRELNGFIRYFMNNNNSGGGGGSNSSQTNSVVTSQTTTAPQSHSSRQSIISPTSQDLNNWRAMTMSSSGGGYRGSSSSGGGSASNDFFVKVARSELISPLRSVLRKELKNTFMMSTASASSSSSSTPTALLNTITSNKLLYGSSAHFGSLDNNYPISSRSSSSPSPRFMNNTSSRKSKINEGKDAVMMPNNYPNNYLGKQRSGGVWRLSW